MVNFFYYKAGKYLAEWALENTSIFQERNIIELGSGTGLTGLNVCYQEKHKFLFVT